MGIVYKIDILEALKSKGYSTYRLAKEKTLPPSTVQRLRDGDMISMDSISKICAMLDLQPGDILKFVPEDE